MTHACSVVNAVSAKFKIWLITCLMRYFFSSNLDEVFGQTFLWLDASRLFFDTFFGNVIGKTYDFCSFHIRMLYLSYSKNIKVSSVRIEYQAYRRTIPFCHCISALDCFGSSSRLGKDVKLLASLLRQHVFLFSQLEDSLI